MPHSLYRTLRVLALSGLVGAPGARAAAIYEGFDYSAGSAIAGQSGGSGWGGVWGGNGLPLSATSPGLTYSGLPTRPGAAVSAAPGSGVAWYYRDLPTPVGIDNTTLYISFLLRPEAGVPVSDYGGLNLVLRSGGGIFAGKSGGKTDYGLEGALGTVSSAGVDVAAGETVLMVIKASFGPDTDRFDLFVNPIPGLIGPGTANATLQRDLIASTAFIAVNNAGHWTTDEIRIGSSFAEVTGVPVPATLGLLLTGLCVSAAQRRKGSLAVP